MRKLAVTVSRKLPDLCINDIHRSYDRVSSVFAKIFGIFKAVGEFPELIYISLDIKAVFLKIITTCIRITVSRIVIRSIEPCCAEVLTAAYRQFIAFITVSDKRLCLYICPTVEPVGIEKIREKGKSVFIQIAVKVINIHHGITCEWISEPE